MPGDKSNVEKGSLIEEQHKSMKTFILTLTLGGSMTSFWPDCCPKNFRVKENKISKQNLFSGLHKEKQIIRVNLPFDIVTLYNWRLH